MGVFYDIYLVIIDNIDNIIQILFYYAPCLSYYHR